MIVAAIVLAAGIGLRDPWPADEPRFALIARDMAANGNWLLPNVGGVLYPDKPPLFFWAVAAFYTITDSIRISFLLPGFIAGLGTLLLVTDLGKRLWDPKTSIWCGVTLLALFQFPLQMKSGQIDGLLCFWTTLSLYGFSRHLLLGPDWRWYALGGLSAGLGIITKGVGFLPYLIFIPYVAATRAGWSVLQYSWRDVRWLLAPAATFLAIGVWLLPMLVVASASSDPDLVAYRDNILFHQTVTRYANSWGHIKPPWYLFTNAIPWLWLPVSLILPWLVPAWWRDIRLKNVPIMLLGSWLLLVLLFFSLSQGKRSLYIFPAAPALALVAGFHAQALVQRTGVQRVLVAVPTALGFLIAVIAMYTVMNPHTVDQWLTDVPTIFKVSAALLTTGLFMITTVAICRRRKALAGFAIAMCAFWIGVSVLVFPSINDTRSGGALISALEGQIDPDMQLGFVSWPEQFLLQWQHSAYHFGFRREVTGEIGDAVQWVSVSDTRRILLPSNLIEPCFDPAKVTTIGSAHRRSWVLADRAALSGNCAQGAGEPQLIIAYVPPPQ
jgi:4-amino-4-deoxy-L-arabinose transferase-like glycosyltransferase